MQKEMSHTNIYYVRSGRIGASAPLYVVLAGGIAGAVLAALYALVVCYNPFVYFSCIATLIFGALIGLIAVQSAQAGRSRSLPFNLLAALWLSLFCLWLHWLVWIMLKLDHGRTVASNLALAGVAGWREFFTSLAANYHLSLSRYVGSHGAEASTLQMMWIWGLEAAIVIAVALLAAWTSTGLELYSEHSGKWARTEIKTELESGDLTPDALRLAMENGDFSILKELDRIDPATYRGQSTWKSLELQLIAEPSDEALRAINVQAVNNRWDTNGKRKQSKETIVQNLLIPLSEYDSLIENLRFIVPNDPQSNSLDARDDSSPVESNEAQQVNRQWPKDG